MVSNKNIAQNKFKNRTEKTLDSSQRFLNTLKRKKANGYTQNGVLLMKTLKEITNDPSLLSICLFYDVLNYPEGKKILKNSNLSKSEQIIIKKLHSLENLSIDSNIKDINKALRYFSADYRILILRITHRLLDIRNLEKFSQKKAKKIAQETLHMYVPLASRLGLHKWRHEMEDICFKYLFPRIAKKLERKFDFYRENDISCLKHTEKYIKQKLTESGIKCTLENRIKSIYSTYRKMIVKNRKFDELTDRLAIRIIVAKKDTCYRALGVIHSIMHPIPGKFKDYIGTPKENGYQSIHTVVFPLPNVTNMPIEIQIRSKEMHKECEFGVASHFHYKKDSYTMRYNKKTRADLIKNLEIIKHESPTSTQKLSHLMQSYFRGDQVLVFDSKNRVYHLTKPASALDFVCIHYKKKIAYLKSVKINGILGSLETLLQDGDVVEAQFQEKKSFSKRWIKMCHREQSKKMLLEISNE
ncbi:MAG: GTP pyrophosphokinase [uncultured bacterium]|nr:MAG: GTP pyrophosphokinase [uncultured bacterium]HCU71160.1 hypothetical protein [Candidatus Moranbacteria bacterium]